jgi:nitrogen fixation protein NifB
MDMKLMSHCRQCRADAVGLIGEDRGEKFTKESFTTMDFEQLEEKYNIKSREEFHNKIEVWRGALEKANQRIKIEQATKEQLSSTGVTKLVAVTTAGEGLINLHFGSAKKGFFDIRSRR